MKKIWKLLIHLILLLTALYFQYFSEATKALINASSDGNALFTFIVFYLTVYLISHVAKYGYSKRYKLPSNKQNNVHFGIENIANFIIGVGFLTLLISLFGINPKELITSLTIVAAAVAILTKEYIVDFLSGIYLSFSNTFEINDYVRIDGQKGKIVEINMLKVKILNDDDDIVIIPNSKVYYNDIINYSRRDVRLMTVDFQIALKYMDNIEELEKEIITSLDYFSKYIDPKSYNLRVVEMKMDHLDLKFQYTLILQSIDMQRQIRRKTIREVFNFISTKSEKLSHLTNV